MVSRGLLTRLKSCGLIYAEVSMLRLAKFAVVKNVKQVLVTNGFIPDLEEIFLVRCEMRKERKLLARQQLWRGRLYWSPMEPYLVIRSMRDRLPHAPSLVNAYDGLFYVDLPVGARAWVKDSGIDRIMSGPVPLLLEVKRGSPIRIRMGEICMDIRVVRQRVLVRRYFTLINTMGWIAAAIFFVMLAIMVLSR